MKEFFIKAWGKLNKPTKGAVAITCVFAPLLIAGSLYSLFLEYEGKWWSALVYAVYALSAVFLAYAVFLICKGAPKIKDKAKELLQKNKVTEQMLKNYPFRTVIFSFFSFFTSILYSFYNGVLSLVYRSVWYGALFGYYFILVCMRGGIVLYHGKRRSGERNIAAEIRKYRNVGWLLIVTTLALSVAILQMVSKGQGFARTGLTIYVFAAYTFYKMTMAIVNIFKARRFEVYTVKAVRSVNLADALVSILALQTALFQSFGSGGAGESIANALTGAGVCALVCGLGIVMIVKGNRRLKKEYAREKI